MKTYPCYDDDGRMTGFDIAHVFVSSKGMARFFGRCPGVTITYVRRLFARDEVHVEFIFEGNRYFVWEPYGDNSRLWIAPEEASCRAPGIDRIEEYVRRHWPGPVSWTAAKLASLLSPE